MPVSKNRQFAKIANDVNTSGTLTAEAISSDVTLGGATIYASRSNLPTSGNTAGDQAFTTDTNRLYIWNGSGWYNVALLNVAPAISSVTDSAGGTSPFSLATDGSVTTITITAADSDGDPLTYSAVADSDFAGLATISQDSSVFTITPFSQDSATTESGTITFTATDGINVASSGVQTFTLEFVSALWDETVLSIGTSSTNSLANSTFVDRSTNAYSVTSSGSPVQTAFHPYLDNWSVEFDADYFTVPHDSGFDFGTGDFTIEFWYYPTGTPGGSYDQSTLVGTYGGNGAGGFACQWRNDGGVFRFSNGDTTILDVAHTLVFNQWVHLAWVRNSGTLTMYIDGVASGSVSDSTNWGYTSSLYIGRLNNTGVTQYTIGNLSNVRIVKGTAVYTSDFTPATENLTAISGTSFLGLQNNRFIDNSSSNHVLTVNGSPKISAFNPFGQGSEYAVGENKGSAYFYNSSTELTHSNPLLSASGDWTIECWVYATDTSAGLGGSQQGIYAQYVQGNANRFVYYLVAGAITVRAGSTSLSYATPINEYEWNHIALVKSSGTGTIYLNGTNVTSGSLSDVQQTTSYIGAYVYSDWDLHFRGYISDFKITDGTAVYTSNFTPPTTPVGNTNADLYLPMDNAGIYDKTGNNTLTAVGDASTSTSQTKFASTAMYFDGTGDKITTSGSNIGDFGTGDFTIEFWVRAESLSGYNSPIADDTYASSSTPNAWCFYLLGTSLNPWKGGSSLMSGGTLSTNTWHHCAWTRSNGTMYLFLDGTQVATKSDSTSFNHGDIIVGSNSTNYYLQGYMENVQILKGVAKYTANFTPPTQTQGRQYQAES